jgi:ATP-dependent DNA helicase DinG
MSLQDSVHEIFSADGVLSRAVPTYLPRAGQTEMALAVARTMQNGGSLVVEAGTGIGKTYSYLVPALLSGERVLVSTATKTLQDQLFKRDLPQLIKVLGLPLRTALLKGRSSYVCLHRLEQARHNDATSGRATLAALAKIESWARHTTSGDLAELPGLDERSPLIALVTSTRDNCLGSPCPQWRSCHVNLARREAMAAELVVVNHHLFFADLAVRESGVAELLPTVRTVIFDEAHQLNETGVQFLGKQLGTGQLLDFARDMLSTGMQLARGLLDWQTLTAEVEHAARDLRMVVGKTSAGLRLSWFAQAPEQQDDVEWLQAMSALQVACQQAAQALASVSEMAPDLLRLQQRAELLAQRVLDFMAPCASDSVRWLDVATQLRLQEAPLDISQAMQSRVFKAAGQTAGGPSWIFTSATLGNDETLSWFTQACGLQDAEVLRVQSPFDYARQACFYVPRHLPKPVEAGHSGQVAELVASAATVIGGRTLVLTTTLRALQTIGLALEQHFAHTHALEILIQGRQTKRELLERFRRGAADGRCGCVLVASASFWEGVDVPGDALQLVVIDKLPFPPPNDPLVQARSRRLEALGRNVFKDYFIPEAAIALKQGAGRLIRSEQDRGILVVCDTRLAVMGYGKRLLASLPAMQVIESEAAFTQALLALTKTSTTDPQYP